MPISKYRCIECGKEFSKILMKPEDAPHKCPVCGASGPIEMGPAFQYDRSSLDRLNCVACDTCGTGDTCGVFAASS